jgi:hypothetical protein
VLKCGGLPNYNTTRRKVFTSYAILLLAYTIGLKTKQAISIKKQPVLFK